MCFILGSRMRRLSKGLIRSRLCRIGIISSLQLIVDNFQMTINYLHVLEQLLRCCQIGNGEQRLPRRFVPAGEIVGGDLRISKLQRYCRVVRSRTAVFISNSEKREHSQEKGRKRKSRHSATSRYQQTHFQHFAILSFHDAEPG